MSHWLEPAIIIQSAGLLGVWSIIFAESGLFFGFFLPGDSLLFTAGFLAAQGFLSPGWLMIGSALAAIAGDTVGYWFGRKVGPKIFSRADSFWFNREHLKRAQIFSERYGKRAIILARFVPIVRTFAPIVAGVGEMSYPTFLWYNILGGGLWTIGLSAAGFWLGAWLPQAENYLTFIILGIIILSLVPPVIEVLKTKKYNKSNEA